MSLLSHKTDISFKCVLAEVIKIRYWHTRAKEIEYTKKLHGRIIHDLVPKRTGKKGLAPKRDGDACLPKVIPIHKSGQTNEIGNYRPISLLTSLCKIFKKIFLKHLLYYFSF